MKNNEVEWHIVRLKAIPPDNGTPTWIQCWMVYDKETDIPKEFKNYCKICYEPLSNHTFELISVN